MDKSLIKCKIPGCNNDLPVGRTYECPRCTRQIFAAVRYFSRPLSELLNLGDEDVTPKCNQNSNQESDRP
jgi:hypothetical protein